MGGGLIVRVCHLVSGDLWAGAEVMACALLKELKVDSGLDLTIIVLNRGRLYQELCSAGLDVHLIDEQNHSFLQILLEVRRILTPRPPQILHSHRYKENFIALLVSRRFNGCRLVATQHGLPETPGVSARRRDRVKAWGNYFILSRFFDRVVSVSRDMMTFFVDRGGFRAERLRVVPNGITMPHARQTHTAHDDFVIGSSGRLFPVKDYPLMIEVAHELSLLGPMRMRLAGEGPERQRLERLVDAFQLSGCFEFMGHPENMESYYSGLDLYLNTSVHEGIPMTILEAMAHGLPVVAPKVGGIPEIVEDGVEGFLVDERTPAAFAERCQRLKVDPELRVQMGRAARNKVMEMFPATAMANRYAQLYREIDPLGESRSFRLPGVVR